MPLSLDNYDLRVLKEIVDAIPEQVTSGTIELYGGQKFTFRWDNSEGHIVTWKEPRK